MNTRSILVAVRIITVGVLIGCKRHPSDSERRALEDFKKQAHELYGAYLAGNRNEAKQSLEKLIQLEQHAELPPNYQAGCLFFDYARLYVLERRTGNDALAEAALIKARYWSLRESELGAVSAERAGVIANAETGDRMMELVDKWDKNHTEGKGPKYLRQP